MKRKLRGVLIAVLSLVFLGSLAGIAVHMVNERRGAEDYAEAASLVKLPDLPAGGNARPRPTPDQTEEGGAPAVNYVWEDPYADALRDMDFTALREVNPDVAGWIVIPDTVISYPLLQGADNAYYLSHTWKGDRNAVGAIFLESRCARDLSSFNTIVYGHRMRGGSMFGTLKYFARADYWQAHPYVYIATDQGQYTYSIFSVYEAELDSDTYRISFADETERRTAVENYISRSVVETGVVPTAEDRILTLSTCTGNGHATRWVVQAVLTDHSAPEPSEVPPEEAELPSPEQEDPDEMPAPAEDPAQTPGMNEEET